MDQLNHRRAEACLKLLNPDGTPAAIDENSAAQLSEYISSVDIDPFRDPQAEDIFYEETAHVLSGERTPEECGDILESRLSAYLSENG